MRHRYVIWLLISLCLVFPDTMYSQIQQSQPVIIGIIQDGSWGGQNQMLQSIKKEILDLTTGEFDVQFPTEKTIIADWELSGIREGINQLLSDTEVDIVITLGVLASHDICLRNELSKPVIAPYILDAEFQQIPIMNGKSGIPNLNYIRIPSPFKRDMGIFKEIVSFERLAVFIGNSFLEGFPDLRQRMREFIDELGPDGSIIGVESSAQQALSKLTTNIDAVYILPIPQLSDEEFGILVDGLIHKKLPSFSFTGAEQVEQGILAGLNQDVINRVSRRVALNVQRILLGEKPEDIPVAISLKQQLTINDATARAIGVSPSWAVLTEAEVIRSQRQIARSLDLFQAVNEAVEKNLDLSAKEFFVNAGKQAVKQARSQLLPSVNLSGTYLVIDKDRAESSFGQQPERMLSGEINATQIVFSEPVWANLSIQKNLQRTREFERDQLKLDIIQAAATAYLNVLQAKSFERIQQENLKLTRQNLEFAKVREVVGSAGPAEVYRWESQIASNRTSVIEANTRRNLAEIRLNRILHRPAEDSFHTKEMDLNDQTLITSYQDILRFIKDRQTFKIFRQFMVEEAFKNSPELAALDAAIAVQKRILRSATNSFFIPTITLQGGMQNVFSREGAGSQGISSSSLPPQLSYLADLFQKQKDLSWNVGVNLSFPLFTSGKKLAIRQQANLERSQLSAEREAVAERIEQRIRSALHISGTSYASIEQSRLAAEAAKKSLEVVLNSYSQGVVSIVVLLDAQNAALITDLVAANSIYDFLIDLMEVERAYGKFNFFSTEEKRKEFFNRAHTFLEDRGVLLK